ncbi:hypothetical protein TYRP_006430 [Tyrophagus putrescentiae]|nr:hypothetical protein TYRP_006430 [Tyrophagus putrescentiae]
MVNFLLLFNSLLVVSFLGVSAVQGAALLSAGPNSAPAQEPANIISHANVKVDSKVVNFRGNPKHKALHIKYENDITINNIVELVQAIYGACVRSKAPDAGRDVCRAKISAVVQNSLNVVFDGVELANHLLINGIRLGEPGSKEALVKAAQQLSKK